jgi:hypothetical protein
MGGEGFRRRAQRWRPTARRAPARPAAFRRRWPGQLAFAAGATGIAPSRLAAGPCPAPCRRARARAGVRLGPVVPAPGQSSVAAARGRRRRPEGGPPGGGAWPWRRGSRGGGRSLQAVEEGGGGGGPKLFKGGGRRGIRVTTILPLPRTGERGCGSACGPRGRGRRRRPPLGPPSALGLVGRRPRRRCACPRARTRATCQCAKTVLGWRRMACPRNMDGVIVMLRPGVAAHAHTHAHNLY